MCELNELLLSVYIFKIILSLFLDFFGSNYGVNTKLSLIQLNLVCFEVRCVWSQLTVKRNSFIFTRFGTCL